MEDRRKVYVEVRARHLIDGTCRPESIKFENDEVYEIDRVKQCCRAASTKVGGTGLRYTVMICGQKLIFSMRKMENGSLRVKAELPHKSLLLLCFYKTSMCTASNLMR